MTPESTQLIEIQSVKTIQDLEKCASILVEAYNAEPWNDQWTQAKAVEKLTCFYNSPKFLGWMAFENGQLLGACVGNIEPYWTGDYFYLKEMFVSPRYQRKGVGESLFMAIKPQLETIGIGQVILFTSNEGFPFGFWQKMGFQEMEGMRMMQHER